MSNLSSFSLLNARVKKYKTELNLEEMSSAFEWVALETILNISDDEIEESITDGSMDGGIDAIYIENEKIVHVFSFKYGTTFEQTHKNFPENDLDKMIVTLDRIYGKNIKKHDVNEVLWGKIEEIWDLFEKTTPIFKYYFCSNKQKPIEQARRKFENSLSKYRFVEFIYLDQEDLVGKILETKSSKINGSLSFVEKQYFERSDGPLKGIVATIAATDLVRLVQSPDNEKEINDLVFNDNVRIFLKLKNKINRSIYETALSDENYEFWYLNNGINIICEECIYTPNTRSPKVGLTNFQIVNGGQTTHALFEAFLHNPEKIDDILLLVRICQTRNKSISEKISATTNSQTPVMTRDLHSNDRIQRKLEQEFSDIGYFYERKRNAYEAESKNSRLDNELLGQVYLAYYLDMPSEAKNSKVLIFGSKYDEIFNEESTTAVKMILPYKIYLPIEAKKQEIQRKKRKREKISEEDAFVSRATFHILNCVKYISQKKGLDLSKSENITSSIDIAINLLGALVQKVQLERGSVYTHDKFFKEVPTNKIIRDYINANI